MARSNKSDVIGLVLGALLLMAVAVVACVALLFAFYFFVYSPIVEYNRRQEVIRREPWRQFERNNGF